MLLYGPIQPGRAQHADFVYQEEDGFYLGCDRFHPMMMNYPLSFEDSAGHYRLAPLMNLCRQEQGCLSCGVTAGQYREYIVDHLRTIQAMGFNTVRITGLSVYYDDGTDAEGNFNGTLATNKYYEFGKRGGHLPHCHVQTGQGLPVAGPEDFRRHGDLIAEVFNIIREERIPLKVMLVTGGHGVEVRSGLYAAYLGYLADRFSDEPVLFAWDFYNEPHYLEKIDSRAYDKVDRASWFGEWYRAVKERAPWQLVTYGPAIDDVFSWDPEIMPADFFSYHIYSNPLQDMDWQFDTTFAFYNANLKYVSEQFTRPWMIGETGLAAVDRELYPSDLIHPIVRSEQDQQAFFRNALAATRRNGALGFGVWQFKDGIYYRQKLNTPVAKEFFMGIVNYLDNNTWKRAAYEFAGYDPALPTPGFQDLQGVDYSNSMRFPHELASGHVFAGDGAGGLPRGFRGAYVSAYVGAPGTSRYDHTFNTFTDDGGKFTLWCAYRDVRMVVKQVRISAPGMSLIYQENWGPAGLSLAKPFILQPLDLDRLPEPWQPAQRVEIRSKEERWDRARILPGKHLVIKKGSRLILSDTLYMRPGGSIVVEAGGVLQIDSGAVAGLCAWDGVVVHQPGSRSRAKRQAGKVVILNGGSVMDADHDIRTVDPGARNRH